MKRRERSNGNGIIKKLKPRAFRPWVIEALNYLLGIIVFISIAYFISFILALGIAIFLLGNKFYRENIYSIKNYIRWHLGLRFIGIIIIGFFSLNFLATNNYLSLDIKVGENTFSMRKVIDDKINNIAFYSGNDFVKSDLYKSGIQTIANVLQYNQKKD